MDPEQGVVAELALGVVARTLVLAFGGGPAHADDRLGPASEVDSDLQTAEQLGQETGVARTRALDGRGQELAVRLAPWAVSKIV